MSSSQILIGLGLTVVLAVACQVTASRFRLPAIVLLLPVGFAVGNVLHELNPENTLGTAFGPLVGLAVALILFDGGLDLRFRDLEGDHQRVVRRLLYLGVPITWAGAWLLAWPLLDLPRTTAVMLGAILIVSGPTVVAPLLVTARPGRRVSLILQWESITIDPIGAIIGAVTFQLILNHVAFGHGEAALSFLRSVGAGALGGLVGTAVLWLLLTRLRLDGALASQAMVAVVIGAAALCDA
jgi:NhaP-type Na+/H+ or K+/H+ antiporter